MIIKEIFVSAFGRLENERFVFDEGLNSRIEKNGYGKTTLLTFIKVMLYGIEDSKRSVTENERKRYLPWRGGEASGYMVIELRGKQYRIERSFGKRSSEDTFTVYELTTGCPTDIFSERPGEDIFGIDKDGFERTVFLSERLLSGKIENDTVSGKLGGLVGARYDIGEYESAVSLLDESKKRYVKRGGGGEIAEIKAEIFECESRIKALAQRRDMYERNLSLIESARREIKKLEGEREALLRLKEQKDAEARRGDEVRRINELKQELEVKEARLKGIDARLGSNPPSTEEILKRRSALYAAEQDLRIEEGPVEERPSVFKRIPTESEISDYIRRLDEAKKSKKNAPHIIMAALLLLSVPLNILGLAVASYFYFGAAACIAIALVISFVNAAKCKSLYANTANKCREFLKSIYISPDFSRDLNSLLSDALVDLKSEQARIELTQKSERERLAKQSALAEARAFFEGYGLSPAELSELVNERTLLLMDIKSRRDILSKMAHLGNAKADASLSDLDPDARLREAYEQSASAERELSRLTLENERLAAELALEEQIRDSLEEHKERLAYCERRVELLELTKKLMVKAKEDMTARYLDGTKQAFLRYIALLGEEGEFTLDTSFDIKKYDIGATREREAYSKGSRELYSFALRLALVDTLYREDKPPIIIDDAFMSLDDEHLLAVRKLLLELGKERQIIYFTCAEARSCI